MNAPTSRGPKWRLGAWRALGPTLALALPFAVAAAALPLEIVQLGVRVVDEAAQPLAARVRVLDAAGRSQLPPAATTVNIGPDHWFVCDGAARLDVPPGRYSITIERGPEYRPVTESISVDRNSSREVRLERWIDLRARGYRSGENHLHLPHGALGAMMAAEDLDFGSSLQWWNGPRYTVPATAMTPSVTLYDAEVENAWGAVYCVGLTRPMPVAWNPARANLAFVQAARADGALICYQGGWSAEALVDALLGYVDVVNVGDNLFHRYKFMPRARNANVLSARGLPTYPETSDGMLALATESYYRLLNCGLRLAAGAGSATGVKSTPAGYNRAYVRVPANASVQEFLEAWRRGRNFVTNGPMVFLTANGAEPGDTLALRSSGGEVRVRVEALSSAPLRSVVVIVNGERVATSASGTLDLALPVKAGAWIAALATSEEAVSAEELARYRQRSRLGGEEPTTLRFGHTSPIYVTVGGAGARVERSVNEAAQLLEAFAAFAERTAAPEFRAEIAHALAVARAKMPGGHGDTDQPSKSSP